MTPNDSAIQPALNAARQRIDEATSRDRGRLLGLHGRWARAPADTKVRETFETLLARSIAQRESRAAALPLAPVDPNLPIASEADRIIELIRTHQVIVIAGETGSGKTTQLPKLCLAAGRGAAGMIGCTQPRRIAARAVAKRVADELGTQVGGVVGYQVRFTDNVGEHTAIKFMTDGILLAEIASDRWLSQYDTLLIDEAHERSLNIDFLLGYLKQLLARRRDLKLIVTSATIDTARFAAHFDDAPVVNVEGRGYPVSVRYRPVEDTGVEQEAVSAREQKRPGARPSFVAAARPSASGPAESIVSAIDELTREDPRGDVLVFLAGEREIRDAHQALERRKYRDTEVLPLYARLSVRDQDRVFNPGIKRRIVLATNVAETSLTVPRIRYVVDPGTARVKRYSPRNKLDRLHVEPISQASANQRMGRCGRVSEGTCIRLYSEADFLSRPEYTDPEIKRAALAGVILRMLSLGLGRIDGPGASSSRRSPSERTDGDARIIENFPFLEPPDPRAIADGWQQLHELGAIDAHRSLTATGRTMARLPVDVKLARMLIAADVHGVSREMLAIASFLGIQDPRERPSDARAAADTAHAEFADPKSEFAGIVKLWDAYSDAHEDLTQSKLRAWCEKRFLGFLRMREWRELHRQLKLVVEELWGSVAGPGTSGVMSVASAPANGRGRDKRRASLQSSSPDRRGSVGPPEDVREATPLEARPRADGNRKPSAHASQTPRDTANAGPRSQAFVPASAAISEGTTTNAHYAALHRALMAGLPTHLGFRTQHGKGPAIFDGPRGRKFQLFPGSPLAKKPPPWVLSATLLDTERVWAMTNAAIEPDWAITELAHLVVRKQFEPHWARSQGRVVGHEQISLFGLVLAPKKPVHYGALFPEESRAIFARDALVTGEINTRSAFLPRNFAMLQRAKEEEAKLRRVGLVVDEDWMTQWYLDRLPAHVHNAQALDAWFGKLDAAQKTTLEWTLDDLLVADETDATLFPAFIALGNARLDVRYRFEPGAADDGMTVVVPLHLLNALDGARLSWLAPGFVLDKATALIKSLPKALRRNFVPAPDFARAFFEAHRSDSGDAFAGTLGRFLKKLTGVEIAALDFDDSALEPHLRLNLRLLDRDGRSVLAESRDLDALRAEFGARAAAAFAERAAEGLAQAGLTTFPATPLPLSVPGAGGVPAYPALHDDGDSASVHVHADRATAQAMHPRGVRRLLQLALAEKRRHAMKQLPISPKAGLLYAAIESHGLRAHVEVPKDRLRADLVDGAFDALAIDLDGIRDAALFDAKRDAIGKALFGEAMDRLRQAEAILALVAEARAKLDSPLMGWARGNLDDMQAQLAALTPPGFLRDTPADALREVPRYLKALHLRGERALRDPVRDQQRMLDLTPFVHALDEARSHGVDSAEAWQALRWDLEELRVSLFAQELGAKGSVSVKKLATRLAKLRE